MAIFEPIKRKKAMLMFYEQNNIAAFKHIFIEQFSCLHQPFFLDAVRFSTFSLPVGFLLLHSAFLPQLFMHEPDDKCKEEYQYEVSCHDFKFEFCLYHCLL